MSSKKNPFQALKQWISKDNEHPPQKEKKGGKYQYLFIILLVGIAFMLISDLWKSDEGATTEVSNSDSSLNEEEVPAFGTREKKQNKSMKDYEGYYENQLKEALEQIVGVDEVSVVVNVDSSEEKIYEKNESSQKQHTSETDQEGGKRSIEESSKEEQIVIIQDGEKEVPIISETKKPKVSGVLVVAGGADNIQIKKWIIEAVTRVLDVPSHRVAVMPKKQ
ncbi:stage III sporulation protein AG [Bacillus seohaeanensis]|jgi:stage III sporulation protein AG|uniref:Stage III sporulation protein AG n=1 Tax=Bacillus seohaeanensis TaxID=284580 RepID=A0ABW5RR57_9BACI